MRARDKRGPRLVVIPTDPIAVLERAGLDWLERYYNPAGMFGEVFALSPLELGEREAHGMTIVGVGERDFKHALRQIRPDVVRAYGGFWSADLACRGRIRGVPVVVSVHDTNPTLLHESVRHADIVICMSGAVQKLVWELGTDPGRTRVLPNRVDGTVFRPIREATVLDSVARRFPPGKHILHVGRRSHQKNLDTLIGALALLPADYSCIFVGLGDRSAYLELAETLGVAERCFWVDSVKNSELPIWYSWCDCMCVPSRWEGFGIVFIEAAACGAAIVTSAIAPMNEYLRHGVSACLVKEAETPKALAAALHRVCENADYRRTLSAGALAAARPFDRKAVDAAEVAIYREVMDLKPAPLSRRAARSLWRAKERTAALVKAMQGRRVVASLRARLRGGVGPDPRPAQFR